MLKWWDYHGIIAQRPPINPTMQNAPGLFWFLTSSCNGSIETKIGRSVVKRYGVICICLSILAVHLEVAFSMDTDSCINAIWRFVVRRSPVTSMVSDNGTNLIAPEAELRREIHSLDKRRLAAAFQCKNIEWHFNPPSASHSRVETPDTIS